LSICLINPKFETSYWGFEYALSLYPGDKRSTMISGALPTVAGLSGDHRVYVLDENVEEIDWDTLHQYDIVGVTGMTVQKTRIREILSGCGPKDFYGCRRPLVSVQEISCGPLRRHVHRRGETTWPEFPMTSPVTTDAASLRTDPADRHDASASPTHRPAEGQSVRVSALQYARLSVPV
jgi:hypothetical protein